MTTTDVLAKIQDSTIACAERIRLAASIGLEHRNYCPALNEASLILIEASQANELEPGSNAFFEDFELCEIPF